MACPLVPVYMVVAVEVLIHIVTACAILSRLTGRSREPAVTGSHASDCVLLAFASKVSL